MKVPELSNQTGLTDQQAAQQLLQDGPNEVPLAKFNFWQAVAKRLWEPSAWILEAALILEIILGKEIQAGFILLMLLFAAIDGAIQAGRANHVLQSLSQKLSPIVAVKRSDKWRQFAAKTLVVGDLISLKRGDIVPADGEILNAQLSLNESSITGESAPVTADVGQTIYAGTEVLNGTALVRVTKTGAASRSGKTVNLINQSGAPGHLQKLLGQVIRYLAMLDTILAVILIIASLIRQENIIGMLPFLAMLFIATIPIAMPSSFAVANSVEAKVLSHQQVLVSDLTGIQEAANLNILLVDKTGTITADQPTVVNFQTLTDHFTTAALTQLATSATDQHNLSVVDQAILAYAAQSNSSPLATQQFTPFNPSNGYSSAVVQFNNAELKIKLGSYSHLLAVATNKDTITPGLNFSSGHSVALMVNQALVGVFFLADQPRADSAASLAAIQQRGVKVIMLTGDNHKTATAIAQQIGLTGEVVAYDQLTTQTDLTHLAGIANVVPENKLTITKRLQDAGYIVGVTGDGVNDAPALKQADVGIAMANAVDLAKRSARMILLTPGLSSITKILDSGHRVYQRMMTWTITKLSRTAELTLLLTIGYLAWHFIPLSLNAMILVAILNDCVTLVLGTDNTTISDHPENWNLAKLSRTAIIYAGSWTLVGFLFLAELNQLGLSVGEISTALYCYLIFSAMLTILMTRTQHPFWRSRPSRAVLIAIGLNCLLTIILAIAGWGIAAISWQLVSLIIILTLFVAVMITGWQSWQRRGN